MPCREEAVFEQGERQMERLLTLQELAEDEVSDADFIEVGSEIMDSTMLKTLPVTDALHQKSHHTSAPLHGRSWSCGDRQLWLVACKGLPRQANVCMGRQGVMSTTSCHSKRVALTLFDPLLCSAMRSGRRSLRSEPPREGVSRGLQRRHPASSTAQVGCTLWGPLPGSTP